MARGQLPKAYLRVDPNLDQTHPDLGAFVRLLCVASRQPKRGRFKNLELAEAALGKESVAAYLRRRDLVENGGGVLEVDGWDLWQEGDLTVGERMRRWRAKHDGIAVTGPSRGRISTSEASGVKASNDPPNPPALQGGTQHLTPAQRLNRDYEHALEAYTAQFPGGASRQVRKQLREALKSGEPLEQVVAAIQSDVQIRAAAQAEKAQRQERLDAAWAWIERHGGPKTVARSAVDWALRERDVPEESLTAALARWTVDEAPAVREVLAEELRHAAAAAEKETT